MVDPTTEPLISKNQPQLIHPDNENQQIYNQDGEIEQEFDRSPEQSKKNPKVLKQLQSQPVNFSTSIDDKALEASKKILRASKSNADDKIKDRSQSYHEMNNTKHH